MASVSALTSRFLPSLFLIMSSYMDWERDKPFLPQEAMLMVFRLSNSNPN